MSTPAASAPAVPVPGSSLELPGACDAPAGSADAGVPWHFGDPHAEQRRLRSGQGAVDLSHRGVVRIGGPDRLGWLHSLTTAQLERLEPGSSALALVLDPHGHVEHEFHLVDDGTASWISVEPGTVDAVVAYLTGMQFLLRVEVADVTADWAVVWEPVRAVDPQWPTWLVPAEYAGTGVTPAGQDRGGTADRYVPVRPDVLVGREVLVPRPQLLGRLTAGGEPAGTWALEALRVAAAVPRLQHDTDHRTLPHEVGWIGPAVHLAKGCYRGQETVARVHNLGRPPRRLVLLHLDGSSPSLPAHGDEVVCDGRVVGQVGSVARHHELGPVATALVRRTTPADAVLSVGSTAAAQQVVVVP
ncbi:MAG: folate-binding protein [Actinomycetota bacterium]|nr:MAG: folate-binding protein [Actinomycetota bacterium]